MNCLESYDLVGFRNECGEDLIPSESGYYLNDLPGINKSAVSDSINKENKNALSLIEKVISLSKKLTLDKIRRDTIQRWGIKSVLESETTGVLSDLDTNQDQQAYNVGQRFEIGNNPNSELFISSISLAVRFTGDVVVKMWDLSDGSVMKEKTIACEDGKIVSTPVYWKVQSQSKNLNVFVGYNATSVPSYKTGLTPSGCFGCKGGVKSYTYTDVSSRRVLLSDNVLQKSLIKQSGTSGLSLNWSTQCSIDKILCSAANLIAPVVMYKAGELLCLHVKYSNRLSNVVLFMNDDYDELAKTYSSDFNMLFNEMLNSFVIPKGVCFVCKSSVKMIKTG